MSINLNRVFRVLFIAAKKHIVRATYADALHLSGKLAKGDPKIRVRNYVHHSDIPDEGGSKEKTLRNPSTQ